MGTRVAARLLDALMVGVCCGVLSGVVIAVLAAGGFLSDPNKLGIATVISVVFQLVVPMLVALAYEVLCTARWGATVGKRIMRLRVIRSADGELPGLSVAARRQLLPFVGGLLVVGGALVYASPWLQPNPHNLGWHDKFAGTRVILLQATNAHPISQRF